MGELLYTKKATIAEGESLSSAVIAKADRPKGILVPANWTEANITFQVSLDNGSTYHDFYDGKGLEYGIVSGAGGAYFLLDPSSFFGVTNFKIRSGTAATPVVQTAAVELTIVM